MSRLVRRIRATGSGDVQSKAKRRPSLVIEGRSDRTPCNHALQVYDTFKDKNGRDVTISYARACVLRHGDKMPKNNKLFFGNTTKKDLVHKDSTGREWK